MAIDRTEFEQVSRHIRDLLSHSDTQKYTDPIDQARSDAVRKIFSSGDTRAIASVLDTWNDEGPLTFDYQWRVVKAALEDWGNDSSRALGLLGRLLGWAYIESAWNAQRTQKASVVGGAPMAVLAAIQLGLNPQLRDRDVLQAIFTHSWLFSELLLRRFEADVKGGLDQINKAQETIEGRISGWEQRLGRTEVRANASDEKILNYDKAIQKYKVQFGILGLTQAFREFFRRKQFERNIWLAAVISLGVLILAVPLGTYLWGSNGAQPIIVTKATPAASEVTPASVLAGKAAAEKAARRTEARLPDSTNAVAGVPQETWLTLVVRYFPFTIIVLLLIYFFRVALMHFNSTQIQLLQLETKIAACGFIEEYVKFTKDSGNPDLAKFESLVFGGIVADKDKVPSTFDPLRDLLQILREKKKEE